METGQMAYVTKHVDWLSITIPNAKDFRQIFPLLEWKYHGKGLHGYRSALINPASGLVCETDSADSDMGHHFSFSGDVLENFRRDLHGTDNGIIRTLERNGGRASRIDLTINIHEGEMTPALMRDALRKGQCKAKANVSRFIEGKNGDIEGDTLYIGSPTSDRQFRCYNKASESGVVDLGAWVRLELELRRLRADGAFRSCALNGTDETISGHMGDFIEWRDLEYQSALAGPSFPPVDIPRKDTNRQRWLLSQVSQALAKEICVDEDFALKFWSSVTDALAKLKSQE
jgi:hypothetical protein